METNYLFIEDARTSKKKVLAFMIVFYVIFAILAVLAVLDIVVLEQEADVFKLHICLSIVALLFAVYFNWGLCSKYLKYYMFISENEIKFFANKQEYTYSTQQLISYEIIKSNNRYTSVKLNFEGNQQYIVTSFKFNDFQNILNYLLSKKINANTDNK